VQPNPPDRTLSGFQVWEAHSILVFPITVPSEFRGWLFAMLSLSALRVHILDVDGQMDGTGAMTVSTKAAD